MTKAAEAKVGMFDLANLDTTKTAEEGAELSLIHPSTGEDMGIFLRLAGVDSPTYTRAMRASADRLAKAFIRNKFSSEENEREYLDLLARVTLAWRGVIIDGQTVPCTRENALALYRRFKWIGDQVKEFIADRSNYLRD